MEGLIAEIRATETDFVDAVIIGTLRARLDMIRMELELGRGDPEKSLTLIRNIIDRPYR